MFPYSNPTIDPLVVVLFVELGLFIAIVLWILVATWFPRRRRGRGWWPVRPETVGRKLWRFVQPKAVLVACIVQLAVLIWIYFPPPWPFWVEPSLYVLAFLAMILILYRTEAHGMREGWVRHRPRADRWGSSDRAPDS